MSEQITGKEFKCKLGEYLNAIGKNEDSFVKTFLPDSNFLGIHAVYVGEFYTVVRFLNYGGEEISTDISTDDFIDWVEKES